MLAQQGLEPLAFCGCAGGLACPIPGRQVGGSGLAAVTGTLVARAGPRPRNSAPSPSVRAMVRRASGTDLYANLTAVPLASIRVLTVVTGHMITHAIAAEQGMNTPSLLASAQVVLG